MTPAEYAVKNFREAMLGHVVRLSAMSVEQLVDRCVEMCAFLDEPGLPLNAALDRVAESGSIEACAMMLVIGVPDERVVRAMRCTIERSPDLVEGVRIEMFAFLLEQHMDDEVLAGRATVRIGPNGEKLYGSKGDGNAD